MIKFEMKKNELYVFEISGKKLLSSNVIYKKYIYSDNKIMYVNGDDELELGILSIYSEGKVYKLGNILEPHHVYYISEDLSKVIYVESAGINTNNDVTEKYKYNLCFWNDGVKKVLRHNIYKNLVNIVKEPSKDLKIYFMVQRRDTYHRYNLYISDIDGNKKILEENIYTYNIFFNRDDTVRVMTYNYYSKDEYERKGYLKINNGVSKFEVDMDSNFDYIISKYGKLVLYRCTYDKNPTKIDIYLLNTNNFEQIKLSEGLKYDDVIMRFNLFAFEEAIDLAYIKSANIRIRKEIIEQHPEYFCDSSVDINPENQYYLCFKKASSKRYYIAKELLKNAYDHRVISNPFELDDSENVEVIYKKEQKEDFAMMYTLLYNLMIKSSLLGYQIFDIDISELIKYCTPKFNIHIVDKDNGSKIQYYEEVYKILMNYYNVDTKTKLRGILINEFNNKYIKRMHLNHMYLGGINSSEIKKKLKEFEHELIMRKMLPSRWKSELDLFRLIKRNFEGAIIHYYPDWLSPQHLDVYVPEIDCAFEYQGVQHFKEVEYFGGSEGFIRRQELDKRKKELCKFNGTHLIEWNYDEPITKMLLKKKLKIIGVDIK